MAELVPTSTKFATIRDVLAKRQADIAQAIPRGIDAQRFTRVALSNFQINPALLECTPASAFTAIMQAAAWGLELDPMLGQAYLVPYKDKRAGTVLCTLQLGYRGILTLARRSQDIARFLPGVVHARDDFRYQRAGRRPDGSLGTILEHIEYDGPDDPGPVVATYVACFFKSGEEQIDVMYRRDIDARRARSRAKDNGPWVTDFDAMALKSVIKRAGKFWPLETSVAAAINQDELVDLGIETPIMLPAVAETASDPAEGVPAASKLDALIQTMGTSLPATIPIDEYDKRVALLQQQAAAMTARAAASAAPPDDILGPTDEELDAEIVRKEAFAQARAADLAAFGTPDAPKPAQGGAGGAQAATGQSGATAEEQARARAKREQAARHEPPRAHRQEGLTLAARALGLLKEREPGQEG